MAAMKVIVEPKLAAPGAGMPVAELTVARLMFKRRLRTGTREGFRDKFNQERMTIEKIVEEAGPQMAGERVLIERVRGLEDSSRFWSMWMTLEHLRIVNTGIAVTVKDLARGVTPAGKVSTADVKPGADVTAQWSRNFKARAMDW